MEPCGTAQAAAPAASSVLLGPPPPAPASFSARGSLPSTELVPPEVSSLAPGAQSCLCCPQGKDRARTAIRVGSPQLLREHTSSRQPGAPGTPPVPRNCCFSGTHTSRVVRRWSPEITDSAKRIFKRPFPPQNLTCYQEWPSLGGEAGGTTQPTCSVPRQAAFDP